ncbi:ribonuclease E inhibitor RraA/Dimethylmenaquinone methyltransferase [Mycena pura]|uniref:Ribonuclease E inhibitor RraA/Dimethylmenaquinone methyltransferase n=1 Tax=Mycena pura TaxID=153505 RepID=A0AAD6VPD5_9AGAR|nr:ribonuclease E inhibitor RraA/Dimethylmenaquinone methyltransferase [Mycena pura]
MSVSRLAHFSTCEISDALIKLGISSGGFIPGISLFSSGKICAPAYTVQMVLASNTSAPRLSDHFVDTAPPGSVIVIDVPQQAQNAVWGGLMSAGAIARAAVGVVISGRCRDLAEHRALGFPVFARAHSTLGQQPFTRPSAINVPLIITPPSVTSDYTFPSVTVEPGDIIVADEDGVVCVPQAMEAQVADKAELAKSIDALCMVDIQAGKGIQATFAKYRGKK